MLSLIFPISHLHPGLAVPAIPVCKFNMTAIFVMAPIALATMMEHIGDMSAISATVGENFIEDPGLHRTLIGDGLATALSALVGGPANTTYGENTGVLELSRVHDPKVIRIAACYAIILSFIPKMAEVIGSMPSAIIGGVSFMLYGMISAIGVRNVVENHVDFTKSRNLNHCRSDLRERSWFFRWSYFYRCRNQHYLNRTCNRSFSWNYLKCNLTW